MRGEEPEPPEVRNRNRTKIENLSVGIRTKRSERQTEQRKKNLPNAGEICVELGFRVYDKKYLHSSTEARDFVFRAILYAGGQ